jgi:LysM repeat protein
MDTRRRRSPLRILAPVALIVFGVALAMIISSANNSGASGSGTSATKAEKARDLGTSTTKSRSRKRTSRDRLPKRIYIVQQGDTLGSIAAKTGIPVAKLQELNPQLDQFSLQTGQRIRIR